MGRLQRQRAAPGQGPQCQRVLKPYWKCKQASWSWEKYSWPTSRRRTSPTGWKRGWAPRARFSAEWCRSVQSSSWPSRMLNCSVVAPDGPAAAPPGVRKERSGKLQACSGWNASRSSPSGAYTDLRSAASCNSRSVSGVPGARGSETTARPAANSSAK